MTYSHQYLPNCDPKTVESILTTIGVSSIDELYSDIPKAVLLHSPLRIALGATEPMVERLVEESFSVNAAPPEALCFLGGGMWYHHIPAAIDEITSRTEFYTSYTPYQPEASQGILQALFEYQSLICDLTGMDVANSSMYDWATAAAEACLMAVRVTKRRRLVVSRNVGPERLQVIKTYCAPIGVDIKLVDFDHKTGRSDTDAISAALDDGVAAVYVENPSYVGAIEEGVFEIGESARRSGSLLAVGVDPVSLGILMPPGEYGADIVVGEGQPLGIPMSYGGPGLGIFAAKGDPVMLRQMPGRIIGLTTTRNGSRSGYTMVLQTREQHIRREFATSNICTNGALLAVAAAAYLALAGPKGLREVAETCLANSHYAAKLISEIKGFRAPAFDSHFFKDFTVSVPADKATPEDLYEELARRGILAGLPLSQGFPELRSHALFSATEIHLPGDIERLCAEIRSMIGE